MQKNKLRIIPLGGINEFGKNMTVFEYGDDMFILDCGMMFPKEDMLGIDYVIPDMSYVMMNRNKLRRLYAWARRSYRRGAVSFAPGQCAALRHAADARTDRQ